MDEAAWAAMCPPVRERYAAGGGSRRGRGAVLALLRLVARLRSPRTSEGAGRGAGGGPPAVPALPARARILAVQPDNLGGMLLTTPALRLLKAGLPESELTVLAGPWAADAAAHCPVVDRVELCPFPGFSRDAPGVPGAPDGSRDGRAGGGWARLVDGPGRVARAATPWRLLLERAVGLAGEGFHLAIVFHADFYWGAALVAVAGVPHRLGYATPDGTPFLTRALPLPDRVVGARSRTVPAPHVADLGLGLAREALALAGREVPAGFDGRAVYEPDGAERAEAARLWRMHRLDGAPAVVAVHPAPGAPAKRWAPERFAMVADHFAGRYGARVLVTGGSGDVAEARAVAGACHHPALVLAGETTFGVLGALLERCRFVVGTDNGALHLATTRGVPTLRLFGPVDPHAWGGWPGGPRTLSVAAEIACAPCHRLDLPPWEAVPGAAGPAYPCLQSVTAERVIDAAERLWAATAPAAAAGR